jgi:hypothetical protein
MSSSSLDAVLARAAADLWDLAGVVPAITVSRPAGRGSRIVPVAVAAGAVAAAAALVVPRLSDDGAHDRPGAVAVVSGADAKLLADVVAAGAAQGLALTPIGAQSSSEPTGPVRSVEARLEDEIGGEFTVVIRLNDTAALAGADAGRTAIRSGDDFAVYVATDSPRKTAVDLYAPDTIIHIHSESSHYLPPDQLAGVAVDVLANWRSTVGLQFDPTIVTLTIPVTQG